MANFRPKKWVFGHQNEICRQNTTRDLFLYHQMGAACKIWANSIGSFPRSGVDWKKRLKLIFEKGLGLGALPRPRKLKRTVWANHLALEAKVKIGPLSRFIFASSMLSLMIFLLEYWHPTDKQHSTCRRTASTSPRFVPAECDDTWSVVYQSGSKWFAWAIGERPPGYRNGVKISILTFLFWKSSPFPLPCGRMGTASLWGASFLLF